MKKFMLLAGVACLFATNASADSFNPYVAARAKYAFSRNQIKITGVFEGKENYNDNVWGGSVALGNTYKVDYGDIRIELEYTRNADAKDKNVKVRTQALLFNFYYDFNLRTSLPLKPYVGAGLGWGRSEFKFNDGSSKKSDVAMQIGTGISYKISDRATADLGYRYITYGDYDKEYRIPNFTYEKVDYKPRAHEILLGVRYDF